MALFGSQARSGGTKNLVEFRAGKMTMKPGQNMVHPDKRKGQVYIYTSEDGLTHFCWKDRKTSSVEDDLIIFPDDCEYKKVKNCTSERVFILKFKASSRKLFFWMQEPTNNDEDLVVKVNEALNKTGGSSGSGSGAPSEQDMQSLLSSMSESQLLQLIGGMSELRGQGSSSALLQQLSQLGGAGKGQSKKSSESSAAAAAAAPPTPAAPTQPAPSAPSSSTGSSGRQVQLQDLQKILNSFTPQTPQDVNLSSGLSSEVVDRIKSNPKTVTKLAPLLPQFGHEVDPLINLEETLNSPQFQSALTSFCAAFPSGQLGPLISQFGLGDEAVKAANEGNLERFLKAIQDGEKEEEAEEQMSTD